MANQKISELDPAGTLQDTDLFPLVQGSGLNLVTKKASLSSLKLGLQTGFIPYSNNNYRVVNASGSSTDNGTALVAAVTATKLLTPNGNALSATNRAVVYLLAGSYDLGTNAITLGQYVDIIGIGTAKDIIVTSSNATGSIQIDNTNDYALRNFTVSNSSGNGCITHNASQTDNGLWEDMIMAFSSSVNTENTIFNGIYRRCEFNNCNGALNGSISGLVEDCSFYQSSCGYSNSASVIISGIIRNCSGNYNCFGATNTGDVTISGTIENCRANGALNFGSTSNGNILISGVIKNCRNTDNGFGSFGRVNSTGTVTISGAIENCSSAGACCFGSSNASGTTISGTIKNCVALNQSFGESGGSGNVIISGIIHNCIGTYSCFGATDGSGIVTISGAIFDCICTNQGFGFSGGGGNIIISGTINDCSCGNAAFGYSSTDSTGTVTISGTISNCNGTTQCFGATNFNASSHGTVIISGTIHNCIATDIAFGSTTSTGKLFNCFRSSAGQPEIHLGKIESCKFDKLTIGGGAKVKYSTIGGNIISGVAITASIYHCAIGGSIDANITNNIGAPYNVIDSNI